MLVLLLMGAFLIPTVENAAGANDLTAQQKFDELKSKGIFTGINDGSSALDQNMNRAQFARVAALLLGLDGIGTPDIKVVTEKPFKDVELDTWYIEEITAAKEAGIMLGSPDGTFSPSKDMTIQEMAVATARVLDIEPEKDANVEGAADWAAGYIKALQNANIDIPTNYTEAATRSDLVSATFQAETVITDKKETKKKEEELKKAEEEKKKQEEQSWSPAPQPVQATLSAPSSLPASGAVAIGTQVSLSTLSNATIYYTTDGSTPTRTNGLVYSVPILVDSAMTVKAIAVKNGYRDSIVMSTSYTIIVQKSALDLINEASESRNWAEVDESTFANAGIEYVTIENLIYIQERLEDGATTRTLAQIQEIVNEVRAGLALTEISNYIIDGYNPKPSATTFAVAGVTGVTADNLDDILNAILDAYQMIRGPFETPFSLTSRVDLQQVVEDWEAQSII